MTDSSPVRVLQAVGGGMDRGGIETWLMNVLRNIDRTRFQMDFVVHTTNKCAYDEEIVALGSPIHHCSVPMSRPWEYARSFRRVLAEHGPYDVVDCHSLRSGWLLGIAQSAGVPIRIAHIYEHVFTDQIGSFPRALKGVLRRLIPRHANCVIACSEASLAGFLGACRYDQQRTHVAYPCIDVERFKGKCDRAQVRQSLGLPVDRPLIVYVARFASYKNQDQVVRIADALNRDAYRVHSVMVGSCGERLREFMELAQRRNDLSVLTQLPDVAGILQASDIFLFPSLNEGFGMVAVEAAAAGLPVVATDLPTIREACAPGHRELMFAPNDDATACASIQRVLADDDLRAKLSAEGVEWASRFHVKRSVEQLTAIYEGGVLNPERATHTTDAPRRKRSGEKMPGEQRN